jgi:hypothetical protein
VVENYRSRLLASQQCLGYGYELSSSNHLKVLYLILPIRIAIACRSPQILILSTSIVAMGSGKFMAIAIQAGKANGWPSIGGKLEAAYPLIFRRLPTSNP